MSSSRQTRSLAAIVGGNIRQARQGAGLTQRQLARLVNGVDTLAVSLWERGVHKPSDENLIVLSEVLGRDIAWFYSEQEAAA